MNFMKQNTYNQKTNPKNNTTLTNNQSKKKSSTKKPKYSHTNSNNLKLPKLEELLKSTLDPEQLPNTPTENIHTFNNFEIPSKSDFENKNSLELNLHEEEDTSSLKKNLKSKKSKENINNIHRSSSRYNTPSLAEILLNKNSNNIHNNSSSNQNSSLSGKTLPPKPFNKTGLLNKSQLKLASYIEKNKDITLIGTKRFTDKSGEYYLKNVQLQKKQDKQGPLSKKLSLTHPQNLDNCFNKLNGNINKIKRNATKIITILPENSLTPIPVKERNSVRGIAQTFDKKQYENAERVAVFIRRMEYSNGMKSHFRTQKKNMIYLNKIIFLQEWWKTMYKILVIQKNIRGFLFRKNLMKILEHQENILKFITTFYNIHGFHLYRTFFDNLKKICDEIKSKKIEMLEDFSEKMEKIEYFNKLRKLRKFLRRWKNAIKYMINKEKADLFRKYFLKKKGIKGLKINIIRKLINDVLGKKNNNNKKNIIDEIYNNKNLEKVLKALKILLKADKNNNNKIKSEIYKRLKIFYFMNIISNIKKRIDNIHKKLAIKKLKKLYSFFKKKSALKRWKKIVDLHKILHNLKAKKQKEIENNKNMMRKAFMDWKMFNEFKNILELLIKYKTVENNLLNMYKILNKLKEDIDLDNKRITFDILIEKKKSNDNNNLDINDFEDDENINLKKAKTYLNNYDYDSNKTNNENNNNIKPFKKRISYRKRTSKKSKKSKKDKLKQKLNQLKKISLLLLIRLYKNKNNKIIKKYFDIWKNKSKNKKNQKYVKKIVLGNSLNISKDSKLSDNSTKKILNNLKIQRCNTYDNNFSENVISTINPDQILDKINQGNEEITNKKNPNQDLNSDEDTSVNMSIMSGINLEEAKCENMKPVIYTSQSFIIDKNAINDIQKEFPKINYYKNITNKNPMKMKGDFRQLIIKNKDLLKKVNPRIQITNATCELEQFSPTDNSKTSINNINILNLNPNISINMSKNYKKKDLKNVISNCDNDIYKPNFDNENEKQRWISMSIPLDNDMANWNFLNSVTGIRGKDNINKFEVIQKNQTQRNNSGNKYCIKEMPNKPKFKEDNELQNLQFKLKEMNYRQNSTKNEKGGSPVKLVKYNKQSFNKNRKKNYKVFSVDINNRNKYGKNIDDNIEELSEESFE